MGQHRTVSLAPERPAPPDNSAKGTEGVTAGEEIAKVEALNGVALPSGGSESPGEIAVVPLRL